MGVNVEQAKYEKLWTSHAAYRAVAPGEHLVDRFVTTANPQPFHRVIDFGCGTGRGASLIRRMTGAQVWAMDFVAGCMDPEVQAELGPDFVFVQHDLTKPWPHEWTADLGYCTDVMEHIPPDEVDRVLTNIGLAARRVFFAISTVDDVMGALIGEPLHLTVQDAIWWHSKLQSLGFRIDASEDLGEAVVFFASVYANGEDVTDLTGMNVSEERIRENMKANLALGLQEVCPHEKQDTTVYLLAGGPSLADHAEEIKQLGKEGALFVTVNGTYKWLLDQGVKPAAQVMVDAREFNARFVDPIVDTCKYLFSSQAAHEAVRKVPKEQAWLWHSGQSDLVKEIFDEHCKEIGQDKEWYPVFGGTTVIGRALIVLAMLGFRKIEVFGWDSCLRDDQHHAYAQPENDDAYVMEIQVGARKFKCHPWMVVQANEVPKLIRYILGPIEDFSIVVHGDGLIAHMLNHAASLSKGN